METVGFQERNVNTGCHRLLDTDSCHHSAHLRSHGHSDWLAQRDLSSHDCSLPPTGNTMTVSYMSGLTLGSAVAYCTYSLTRDAHSSCFQTATANDSIPVGP